MKTPKPRVCRYYGTVVHASVSPNGTWLEDEAFCYPAGGMTRRARAVCQDGKLRVFKAGIADTFFTVPARGTISNKSVHGFLTSDENGIKFNQYADKSTPVVV